MPTSRKGLIGGNGRRRLERAVARHAAAKLDKPIRHTGILGTLINGTKTVDVTGRPGWVWVKSRGVQSELIKAFNQGGVQSTYGLPVIIERDSTSPDTYNVIGRNAKLYASTWPGATGIGSVAAHHKTHERRPSLVGNDVVEVWKQQLKPIQLTPNDTPSMSAYIYGDWYWNGNTLQNWPGSGTVNFTTSVPSSGARFVTVYLDAVNGIPKYLSGTVFSTLTVTNYTPFIPQKAWLPSEIPLGAVLLISGMSAVNYSNIVDLRPALVNPEFSLSTKGDLYTHSGSVDARLGVGTDGQILWADSSKPTGLNWGRPSGSFTSPLTTTGDLYTRSGTVDARLGVGSTGQILYADASKPTGLNWGNPSGTTGSSPLTTKGDLYTYDTGNQRLGVGGDNQVLLADSTQPTGLRWATPPTGPNYSTRYYATSGSITSGVEFYPQFRTKDYDNTPSAVSQGSSTSNLGTAWRYTAPVTGIYQIHVSIGLDTTNNDFATGKFGQLYIYKNSGTATYWGLDLQGGGAPDHTTVLQLEGTVTLSLNAGDFITPTVLQNTGAAKGFYLPNVTNINYIEVVQIPTLVGGNGIISGSTGYIPKYASSSTLTPSVLQESSGDIFSTAWTDYSATSTIVGWSSFTTKVLRYKKIGKLVYVVFNFAGTSNSTAVSFTLPSTPDSSMSTFDIAIRVENSGAFLADPGLCEGNGGSATVSCYKILDGTAFTNSGTKAVSGQFFYEEA